MCCRRIFLRTAANDSGFGGGAVIINNLKIALHLSAGFTTFPGGIMIALETDKCAGCNQARMLTQAGLYWDVLRSLGERGGALHRAQVNK